MMIGPITAGSLTTDSLAPIGLGRGCMRRYVL